MLKIIVCLFVRETQLLFEVLTVTCRLSGVCQQEQNSVARCWTLPVLTENTLSAVAENG